MRRILSALFVLAAVASFAQDATVTYLLGDVDIRKESGSTFPADFGDALESGDRVITARSGEAELELAEGGVVDVLPDTVFIIGSAAGRGGEPTTRLAAAVGSFSFVFNRATGREPQVGSTTSVAGVRGTEVRVLVGSDGTTRYEVLDGLVELESEGETVSLGPEQGVEVTPGRGAGSVFAFLEQPIDYSVWNAGLVDNFLADPLSTLDGLASEMDDLIAEIERRGPEVDALVSAAEEANAKLSDIEEAEGVEARQEYFRETVAPLRLAAREAFVDFRFVVLSALSLDQFIVSRLVAEMDARYFLDPNEETYVRFMDEVSRSRARFEDIVVPRLVPSDY